MGDPEWFPLLRTGRRGVKAAPFPYCLNCDFSVRKIDHKLKVYGTELMI